METFPDLHFFNFSHLKNGGGEKLLKIGFNYIPRSRRLAGSNTSIHTARAEKKKNCRIGVYMVHKILGY